MPKSKASSKKLKKNSKQHRIEKTLFECLMETREGSEIQIKQSNLTTETPACIIIRLRGPIAAIPCFKNNRKQGKWLQNHVTARLNILDELFEHATKGRKIRYEEAPLFVYARFAVTGTKRGPNFDPDNALTTVKDWLEPRFKNHRDRGWGVGVISNDKYIKAFGERQAGSSKEAHITEIVIRPLDTVTDALMQFRKHLLCMKKWEFNGEEGS